MASVSENKVTLSPREMPRSWYNLAADLPFRIPPMMSPSGYPITSRELEPLFPVQIRQQEFADRQQRSFRIPPEVKSAYAQWRPTPMFRARKLEARIGTPARLYYKFEGGSPSGSYESNTAIPVAHYVRTGGFSTIVTGGAGGVWVNAVGHACTVFGIKARVYSVRDDSHFGEAAARLWGIDIVESPSRDTRVGARTLETRGSGAGSIGVALAEAYEEATLRPEVKFAMPTLLNHTAIHQSVIGLEAFRQLAAVGEEPAVVIGAVGGGAHFAGLLAPFMKRRVEGAKTRFVAVETASTPSLTRGVYAYDSADSAGQMPMVQMYTLGHEYTPPGIFAGGMRYHGVAPLISALYKEQLVEAVVHSQLEAYEAGLEFTRSEGVVLSPASMYTVKEVIDEARRCKDRGKDDVILFSITTSIDTDSTPYDPLLSGELANAPAAEGSLVSSVGRLLRFRN